jgi:hypothetical protein
MHTRHTKTLQWSLPWILGAMLVTGDGLAATFDVSISPPRVERRAKAGKLLRDRITITNFANEAGQYRIKTADWVLTQERRVTFNEGAPHSGSCRPWVRIERRKLTVPAGASKSYRFEVHVPANTPDGECRFALLVSGDPETISPRGTGNIKLPIVGRVAVIVYVTIGKAKPDLKLLGLEMREHEGKTVPMAILENVGNAHGRPLGDFTATDSTGRRVNLIVEQFPVLPGETRAVALRPMGRSRGATADTPFDLKTPLTIRGKIHWDGGSAKVNQVVR